MMQVKQTISFKNHDARTDLFSIVKAQDFQALKNANLSMSDLDQRDAQSLSAINYAIILNDQSILDYFYSIAENYYLNGTTSRKNDEKGRSLMHWAAKCNQSETVINKLISLNFSVDDQIPGLKITPLYLACQDGCVPAAQALIKLKADVNAEIVNGATPIHAAAENGSEKLIEALLSAGANISKTCHQGGTPLFIAAQKGHAGIVKMLINAGGKVNVQIEDGGTPLIVAAQFGYVDIVKTLVAAKADISLTTKTGINAREAALKNNHTEIAALLAG